MKRYTWTVEGTPGVKRRTIASSHRGKARVRSNPKSVNEERNFLKLSRASLPERPLEGPIRLDLVFVYAWPNRHPAWKKEAGWKRDCGADIDNLIKCVLDSLNGAAWADDRQVFQVTATKQYGVASGTLVIMTEVPQPKRPTK